jgi:hypothetical protein
MKCISKCSREDAPISLQKPALKAPQRPTSSLPNDSTPEISQTSALKLSQKHSNAQSDSRPKGRSQEMTKEAASSPSRVKSKIAPYKSARKGSLVSCTAPDSLCTSDPLKRACKDPLSSLAVVHERSKAAQSKGVLASPAAAHENLYTSSAAQSLALSPHHLESGSFHFAQLQVPPHAPVARQAKLSQIGHRSDRLQMGQLNVEQRDTKHAQKQVCVAAWFVLDV